MGLGLELGLELGLGLELRGMTSSGSLRLGSCFAACGLGVRGRISVRARAEVRVEIGVEDSVEVRARAWVRVRGAP